MDAIQIVKECKHSLYNGHGSRNVHANSRLSFYCCTVLPVMRLDDSSLHLASIQHVVQPLVSVYTYT